MPVLIHIDGAAGGGLACAVLAPLLLSLLGLFRGTADAALKAGPVAALPALALSVGTPVELYFPDLLLGSGFSTGGHISVWLFTTAALWFGAAWFGCYYIARDERRGLSFFFFGSMSGNTGLLVASDPPLFIAFFAVMSFMSYGLVVHDRKPESMRAGRVYLAMAVLGEVFQFAGLSRMALPMVGQGEPLLLQSWSMLAQTDTLSTVLFVAGFGVKAGLLGLHMWLPMAHPVAPTPASAVLSGSMIKAGLIGWINLLPLGVAAMPEFGACLVALGLAGALSAALIGSVQKHAKAVLAYSSVSQMGLIVTVFGIGLGRPGVWRTLFLVAMVYAVHHAFAKCVLFLSVGLKTARPIARMEAWVFWGGTGFAALALAGAPATSGMVAKIVLKDAVAVAAPPETDLLLSLLTVAAVGTTLLMARFVDLLRAMRCDEHHMSPRGIFAPWLLLLSLVGLFAWYLAGQYFPDKIADWSKAANWGGSLGPIFFGVALYFAGRKVCRLLPVSWQVPPGDIYIPFSRVLFGTMGLAGVVWSRFAKNFVPAIAEGEVRLRLVARRMAESAGHAESRLATWRFGGAIVLLAGSFFFWLALS